VSEPEGPGGGGLGGHLEAVAAGEAVINQAGRDLHLHLGTGERAVRRAGPGAAGECPYPGLAAFTAEQADWFFGRDRLTADLIGRLGDCVTEGGPLMVVAPSGAGKSSLLRAGLLAGLSRGALAAPGSSTWPQLVFTPGRHPLREAATHLAALTDCPVPLDPGPPELTSMLRQALGSPAAGVGRAVLVVDQFEQLFTLCADEDERAAFAGWLWDLAQPAGASGPLALVACGLRRTSTRSAPATRGSARRCRPARCSSGRCRPVSCARRSCARRRRPGLRSSRAWPRCCCVTWAPAMWSTRPAAAPRAGCRCWPTRCGPPGSSATAAC